MNDEDATATAQKLAAPFDPAEVLWKPQKVSGNKALALAYVTARVIQDRLDDVLGVAGWQDKYECLPDGSVVCQLKLKIGEEWITKMDVGSPSEQPDEHDRMKAAFSDALKRAAVKFGVGRYLYRLPAQWADYDPQKRQFVRVPQLPAWAVRAPHPSLSPAQPKVQLPNQVPARSRADTAKDVMAVMGTARTLPELKLAFETRPKGFDKIRDEHLAAVLEFKDGRKLAILANRIDELREALGFDDVQMGLACQSAGLSAEPTNAEDAARLIAALEAEAGRVETEGAIP